MEYDELVREIPDPEDIDPVLPDEPGESEPVIMTRAELTAKVQEQTAEIADLNEALDMLLSGVTE